MRVTVKRIWWRLRVALHDWMWDGGSEPNRARRLSRRLPLYFSDPFYEPRAFTSTTNGCHVSGNTFTSGTTYGIVIRQGEE